MIRENVEQILEELPKGITLVVAAKSRTVEEIIETIDAGAWIIGQNYLQEGEKIFNAIGQMVQLHFIGHLQSNKIKRAVNIFDMIQTVDTMKIAMAIDKECNIIGKIMPVLIEVNSGKEPQKHGLLPDDLLEMVKWISCLKNVKLQGLMTMGPFTENPEDARPYFQTTKQLFDEISSMDLPNVDMKFLSMGMSNTYQVAIEEGANLVRIGTQIFGPRV